MKHLTEYQLTSVFEDTLPAEQEERILLHLAKCEACERRAEPAMQRYRALRRDAAKTVPRPPHPWRDIQMEMDRADAILPLLTHSESRKPRQAWTGLVAGAVLGTVLLLWPRPDAHLRGRDFVSGPLPRRLFVRHFLAPRIARTVIGGRGSVKLTMIGPTR